MDKEKLCDEIAEMVVSNYPKLIEIKEPFMCPSIEHDNGWALGTGLQDHDSDWHDPIQLMCDSLYDGWEDEELKAAIKGTEKLLKTLVDNWNKYSDRSTLTWKPTVEVSRPRTTGGIGA